MCVMYLCHGNMYYVHLSAALYALTCVCCVHTYASSAPVCVHAHVCVELHGCVYVCTHTGGSPLSPVQTIVPCLLQQMRNRGRTRQETFIPPICRSEKPELRTCKAGRENSRLPWAQGTQSWPWLQAREPGLPQQQGDHGLWGTVLRSVADSAICHKCLAHGHPAQQGTRAGPWQQTQALSQGQDLAGRSSHTAVWPLGPLLPSALGLAMRQASSWAGQPRARQWCGGRW